MAQTPRLAWTSLSPQTDLRHVWNKGLIVWEKPSRAHTYVLGVDVGQGRGADNSVVEVLRVGDERHPDQQVAEFATNVLGPKAFAEVVAAVGKLYAGVEQDALCIVERNTAGGGDLTLEDLRFRWGYTNLYSQKNLDSLTNVWSSTLGWHTGQTNRAKLTLATKQALESQALRIHSPLLLGEMETFEGDGIIARAQAAQGQHDDRVLALCLAYWAAHEAEWLRGEDISRRRSFLTQQAEPLTSADEGDDTRVRRDFQNTDASIDEYNDFGDDVVARFGIF